LSALFQPGTNPPWPDLTKTGQGGGRKDANIAGVAWGGEGVGSGVGGRVDRRKRQGRKRKDV
jgi:hypothetical protein